MCVLDRISCSLTSGGINSLLLNFNVTLMPAHFLCHAPLLVSPSSSYFNFVIDALQVCVPGSTWRIRNLSPDLVRKARKRLLGSAYVSEIRNLKQCLLLIFKNNLYTFFLSHVPWVLRDVYAIWALILLKILLESSYVSKIRNIMYVPNRL